MLLVNIYIIDNFQQLVGFPPNVINHGLKSLPNHSLYQTLQRTRN